MMMIYSVEFSQNKVRREFKIHKRGTEHHCPVGYNSAVYSGRSGFKSHAFFFQVLRANADIQTQIWPQPYPATPFIIHYSLNAQPFIAV
jgi:hypothetical protein